MPAEVSPPPGVDASMIQPHGERAMAEANKPWAQIIAQFSPPKYLEDAETAAANGQLPPPPEMPLEAQRAYAYAREAVHERKAFEAIFQLNEASRIVPDQPDILRALADIYRDTGNLPRSAELYQRLVKLEPHNPAVLYELGRIAVERGDDETSIAVLARARDNIKAKNAGEINYLPLLNLQLAEAMSARRYDREAINAWLEYLKAQERPRYGNGRASAELYARGRHLGMTWTSVGDAFNRLDEPEHAIEAYIKANEHGVSDTFGLGARMAYTYLRIGDVNSAMDLVAASFNQQEESRLDDAASLAKWLGHTVPESSPFLADRVKLLYDKSKDSSLLAIVLADLLPRDEGDALLREYLERDPRSRSVFNAMLDRSLSGDDSRGPAQVAQAIEITALVCRPRPRVTPIYANQLIDAVSNEDRLLEGFDALSASLSNDPVVRLIKGSCLTHYNRHQEAERVYAKLIADRPDLITARAALVKSLLERGEEREVILVLDDASIKDHPELIAAKVEAFLGVARFAEALRLINKARQSMPEDIDLIIADARARQATGDLEAAVEILDQAVKRETREERLYEELLNLYYANMRELNQGGARYVALIAQAEKMLPQSITPRLNQARTLRLRGESEQALRIVNQLSIDHPGNADVLSLLVLLIRETDELRGRARVIETMQDRVASLPDNVSIINEVVRQYIILDEYTLARELVADALNRNLIEVGDDRIWGIFEGGLYYKTVGENLDDRELRTFDNHMITLAEMAPEDAEQIHYYRALRMHSIDQEKSEQILLDLLAKNPNHAEANNQLGYTWVDEGRNLNRALKMIERAVAVDPDSAMYVDSLGWAHYKLGQFDEAVKHLQKAVKLENDDPVLNDHLGDALFKVGRVDEAVATWKRLLEIYEVRYDGFDNIRDDDEVVRRNARIKIIGVRSDREIPVADSPGPSQ